MTLPSTDIELINPIYLNWGIETRGFGQLYFYQKDKEPHIRCMNEGIDKDTIKKILCDMVDNCTLEG